jgi:phage anti-repressor protein
LKSKGQIVKFEQPDTSKMTPIEIALGIDKEGKTTAKKLYKFLELEPKHYARWVKSNVIENQFAEENVDFFPFRINAERTKDHLNSITIDGERKSKRFNPKPSTDYKLTADFAKKLSMISDSPKGEIAREYFIKVEGSLKQLMIGRLEIEVCRKIRKELTDVIEESGMNDEMHGWAFKTVTDLSYKIVFGKSAKQMREERGLAKTADIRQCLSIEERTDVAMVEDSIKALIRIGYNYQDVKSIMTRKFIEQKTA